MRRFFSGKRFPLATLSNIEDQIFFFGPSLLDGRLLFPVPDLDPGFWLDVDIVLSNSDHASICADHATPSEGCFYNTSDSRKRTETEDFGGDESR